MREKLPLFLLAFSLAAIASLASSCASAPTSPRSSQSVPFELTKEFGSRLVQPFTVKATGKIRVEASWSGSAGSLALILNGPGKVGYYQRIDGPSPISVSQEVTPEILALGEGWTATITNFDTKGVAKGTMKLSFPISGAEAGEASLQEPFSPKNLVANGDFSSGLDGWSATSMNGAKVSAVPGDGEVLISILASGKSSGDIQLSQSSPGISVEKGKSYRLSFEASSSLGKEFYVTLSENGLDLDKDGFRWSPIATATPKPGAQKALYTTVLTAKESHPSAALVFYFGRAEGEYALGDISLVESR
jgi:hypothetical protein